MITWKFLPKWKPSYGTPVLVWYRNKACRAKLERKDGEDGWWVYDDPKDDHVMQVWVDFHVIQWFTIENPPS